MTTRFAPIGVAVVSFDPSMPVFSSLTPLSSPHLDRSATSGPAFCSIGRAGTRPSRRERSLRWSSRTEVSALPSDSPSHPSDIAAEVAALLEEHGQTLVQHWARELAAKRQAQEPAAPAPDLADLRHELRHTYLEPYLADLRHPDQHNFAAAVWAQYGAGPLQRLEFKQARQANAALRDSIMELISRHFHTDPERLLQALRCAFRPLSEGQEAYMTLYSHFLSISEKRRQDFFEDAIHAAFLADLQGLLTDINTQYERLFGLARSECLGKHLVEELVARGLSQARAELIWETLQAEGRIEHMRCTALDRDGRNLYVELTSGYTLDPDETRNGIYGMLADITDRREAELRLEETNTALAQVNERLRQQYVQLRDLERTKEDLTAMIVHDMRNPVSVILVSLDTLRSTFPATYEDQGARELLEMAERSGRQLMNMINDLLDISRLESGAMKLKLEPVPPVELQEAALERVALLIERDDLTLRRQAEQELPLIMADREALIRVLVNLLTNALKFTPAGGEVRSQVQRAPEEAAVTFSVADTGPGIPPEFHEKIFEKFAQVDARRQGTKPSTGLGLTYCKLAVEAHGGRIWLRSEPGHGAEFFFTIPAADDREI